MQCTFDHEGNGPQCVAEAGHDGPHLFLAAPGHVLSRMQRLAGSPYVAQEYQWRRKAGLSPTLAAARAITWHDRGWDSGAGPTTESDAEAVELARLLEGVA